MARYRVTVDEITRDDDKTLHAHQLHMFFADAVQVHPDLEGQTTLVLTNAPAPPVEPVLWICEHGKLRGEHCGQCLVVTTKE